MSLALSLLVWGLAGCLPALPPLAADEAGADEAPLDAMATDAMATDTMAADATSADLMPGDLTPDDDSALDASALDASALDASALDAESPPDLDPSDAAPVDARIADVLPPDLGGCEPAEETLDGTDEDCDGVADEEVMTPDGLRCGGGERRPPCNGCPVGSVVPDG